MNRSIGDSILVGGVSLFASWTLLCYMMVLSESGYSALQTWSILAVFVGLILGFLCTGKLALAGADQSEGAVGLISSPVIRRENAGALFVLAITALFMRVIDAPYWSVWLLLLCTTVLVYRAVSTSVEYTVELRKPGSNWPKSSVTALVILGMVLVAITHRPDEDDSQYLNFVVTALDFPFEALFSRSGLWQDPNVPLELPIYRFHTYELLVATLSDTFGVNHKTLYYLILAPVFGGVAVLVHWRLAQYLVPQHAVSMLIIWLVLIIALGASHQEFGSFAFVRLHQGKGLLVTIFLPLCLLLGLRFAEAPDWRRALALGLGAVASLGMSSSALPTVPFVLAATLGGGLLGASRVMIMRILVGGLASSFFLLAIGSFLVVRMKIGDGLYGDILPSAGNGLSIVLGEGVLGALVLILFPVAPIFVAGLQKRRLYAVTTSILVVAVLNPWSGAFFARMFDNALEWRLFWSVPFVISASISMAGLAALIASKVPLLARHAVLPIIVVAVLLLSSQWSISPGNRVVIAPPRFKVEPEPHKLAEEIVHRAPLRSTIYAPFWIAEWITTFREHPYPLVVRPHYLDFERIQNYFGITELDRRRKVIAFLEGRNRDPSAVVFFQAQLAIDRPAFVVYDNRVEMAPAIAEVLVAAGYIGEMRGIYWLWHLQLPPAG